MRKCTYPNDGWRNAKNQKRYQGVFRRDETGAGLRTMPCHTFEGLMAALRPPYVSLRPHETCCCLYSPLLWAGGWFLICSVEGLQVAGPETGRLEYWESEGVLGGVLVGWGCVVFELNLFY